VTATQIIAGTEAKRIGHLNEQRICDWLNTQTAGHVVDGKPKTKQDIINLEKGISYSLKSVSKNHTQCHLTSTEKWCEFFSIGGNLRVWFDSFFGIPGKDVSNGQNHQHRLTKSEIDDNYNDWALEWFNQHKLEIFDVIVRRGMSDTPVNYLIWFDKPTDRTQVYSIEDLEKLVYDGKWIMKETTLHFMDANGNKMFHLQMKGSGKKYTSGYHGLMFHIYKTF
jgi:hypothetical protein